MLVPFMVMVVVVPTVAGQGWFEMHRQFRDIDKCRYFAERMQDTPKFQKIYCHMEGYGPNYTVLHHVDGSTKVEIDGWEVE